MAAEGNHEWEYLQTGLFNSNFYYKNDFIPNDPKGGSAQAPVGITGNWRRSKSVGCEPEKKIRFWRVPPGVSTDTPARRYRDRKRTAKPKRTVIKPERSHSV